MLLSALLTANICACNYAPENEIDITIENTTFPESMAEEPETTDTEPPPTTWEGTIACNGVYRNSNVKYTVSQDNNLILYIENWNESFVVPKEDMYFVYETLEASSVVMGENRGALIFSDFSRPAKPIKVIQFMRGNQEVTIENLTVQTSETYAFKYCNFIDEQIGYLFLFDGPEELSTLLKTMDEGQTWELQLLENVPAFRWNDHIICAKMINEKIGFISAGHRADDNFSKRTYVTIDGGKNWVQIVLPPNDFFTKGDSNEYTTYIASGEAYDLLCEDGQYILYLRQRLDSDFVYFKYSSIDLDTWSFVE